MMMVVYCCVLFFFFKQKTAYEMRISDWSSDVCSSDRYIRHSSVLFNALKQVFVFTSCASALWALMPLVAKDELDMDAGGYGLLMAFMGGGAVVAALNLTKLYRRFTLRTLIASGALAFAAATLAADRKSVL